MNNLLIWPLTETDKIIFTSSKVTLATITCCDSIDVFLKSRQGEFHLVSDLTGCQFNRFKNELLSVINKTQPGAKLVDSFSILCSSLNHFLVQIYDHNTVLAYFLVDLKTIQAWISQLDLLEVVMQENENDLQLEAF